MSSVSLDAHMCEPSIPKMKGVYCYEKRFEDNCRDLSFADLRAVFDRMHKH